MRILIEGRFNNLRKPYFRPSMIPIPILVLVMMLAILGIRLWNIYRSPESTATDEALLEGFSKIETLPSAERLNAFLMQHFPFFQRLGPKSRQKFMQRMYMLLRDKYFGGREGLVVHDVMILLICATLVQLTFGLRVFSLPRFRRIVLYPDVFYSRLIERDVKGLTVYHSGIIALSWPHAFEGHQIPNDKVNLILHELAHALYLDYFGNRSERYGFSMWKDRAMPVLEAMQREGKHPFLREYAASNISEFWAVCVEHFFEAPEAFQKVLPELYTDMRSILQQDPMLLAAHPY